MDDDRCDQDFDHHWEAYDTLIWERTANPPDDDTAWAAFIADALAWQAEWPERVWPKCDEEMEPLGPIEWGEW